MEAAKWHITSRGTMSTSAHESIYVVGDPTPPQAPPRGQPTPPHHPSFPFVASALQPAQREFCALVVHFAANGKASCIRLVAGHKEHLRLALQSFMHPHHTTRKGLTWLVLSLGPPNPPADSEGGVVCLCPASWRAWWTHRDSCAGPHACKGHRGGQN